MGGVGVGGYQIPRQPQLCSEIFYRKERRKKRRREEEERSSSPAFPHFDNIGNKEETKYSDVTKNTELGQAQMFSKQNYMNGNRKRAEEGEREIRGTILLSSGYHTVSLRHPWNGIEVHQRAHQSQSPPTLQANPHHAPSRPRHTPSRPRHTPSMLPLIRA